MKNLKKITVHNAEDVLSNAEMRVLTGGYGEGVAKGCGDHKTPEECLGSCAESVGDQMRTGECDWVTISLPGLSYAGCVCVIG